MLDELASLQRNIDHIKTIVSRQQAQVKATLGVLETVRCPTWSTRPARLAGTAIERQRIDIQRDYQELPSVRLDRHKLLEILTNLLSNARHALAELRGSTASRSACAQSARRRRFQIEVERQRLRHPLGEPGEDLHLRVHHARRRSRLRPARQRPGRGRDGRAR